MSRSLTRASGLSWGAALVVLALSTTGSAQTLAMVDAATPAQAKGSSTDPQDGPADDFAGYIGLAGAGAGAAAVADDRPGDKKAEPLGRFGKYTSTRPDVPGKGVVEVPDSSASLVPSAKFSGGSAASLRAAAHKKGSVRVIVTMEQRVAIEADLTRSQVKAQRAAIADRIATIARTLAGTNSRVVREFTVVPSAVAVVDRAGLDALLADPAVAAVTLDREAPLALNVSTGVIDSDLLNSTGVLGNNYEGGPGGSYEVAILDSGVDNQHTAFSGRVVAQACFSATNWCPNGGTSMIGGAAGDNCTFSSQCDHGTHVGGIAAGAAFTDGHEGVARGARIVAVQIGHRSFSCQPGEPSPCWRYFFSDLDLALQHVLNLRNGGRNIAAINLSLGGPLHTTEANCQAAFPNTQNLAANLTAAGVAVVAAAGNNGSGSSVSYPGCLPSTYTVAASDDVDNPAGFSNNNAITDWWAPGVSIDAPVTTSTTAHGLKSGTSMATPHVVGAMALLRECIDPATEQPQTVGQAAADLYATGPIINHDGVSRHRINVLDAATRNVNNNDFASAETIPGNVGAGYNDIDWTVCSDTEPGEPGPYSLDNGIWWNWTPSATGTATISTDDNGGSVTTFDSTLAVYTGNTLPTLSLVANDDDSGVGARSKVVIPVNGGTTYRIKVDGFGAANGRLNLHVELGPAPLCQGVAATRVGTAFADVLNGTAGDDVIVAGDGNDVIAGLSGNDRVCAGAGEDNIAAGDGNDAVFGGPAADTIRGEAGDDLLLGNAGGGDTDDVGDSIAGGSGNDTLDGWVGDDLLIGGAGNDTFWGMAGIDTVSYAASPAAVVANLTDNTATGDGNDAFIQVDNITGSAFNDRLFGSATANRLDGLGGNDRINGVAGNDLLLGGSGNDHVQGQSGDDALDGGPGRDMVLFEHSPASVTVDLAAGTATGDGTDTVLAFEDVIGSNFADVLRGTGAPNDLYGGSAADVVRAGGGNDRLFGERGADRLFGENGNDHLSGGTQFDRCAGGAGTDTQNTCEVKVGIP